jgi:CheY-like chemotaxis protein
MSAVLGIVRAHKGAILVDSAPGRGSTFTVLVQPRADRPRPEATTPSPAPPVPASASAQRGCLLVVDDEAALCDLACRMVERLGFTCLRALDGAQAVAVFKDHAAGISAVLMDLSMPNMDGVAAYHEMVRIRPDIPVILTSGFSEQDAVARFEGVGLAGFLQKPYTMNRLEAALSMLPRPPDAPTST